MVAERRFTVAELSELLTNPVRWPLARRLVWGVYPDAGPADACAASFRLAEDRTFADLDDRHLELAPEALVGVAHPIQLGDDVARWSDLLADYELLQPFLQLGREVFVATAEQLGSTSVGDLARSQIESVRFLGLEGRGWERREVGDGGMTHRFVRLLAAERALVLDVDPGLFVGQPTMYPVQTVAAAQVQLGQGWGADALALGELGAVERSEVLREVAWLRS